MQFRKRYNLTKSADNAGDLGLSPGSERSPGVNPLQYAGLSNSVDIGAWQATVNGVAKSWMTN